MGASDEHGDETAGAWGDRAAGPGSGAEAGNGRRPHGDPLTNGAGFAGRRGDTGRDGSPVDRAATNGAAPAASDTAVLTGRLRVWIDQDLCTGDGICTDHAPDVFTILEDGIAYCQEGDRVFNDPGGSAELAVVPVARETDVVDAAAECPGECIFIEIDAQPELTD